MGLISLAHIPFRACLYCDANICGLSEGRIDLNFRMVIIILIGTLHDGESMFAQILLISFEYSSVTLPL